MNAHEDTTRIDRLLRGLGRYGHQRLKKSSVSIVFDDEAGKYMALPFVASGIPVRLIGLSPSAEGERVIDQSIASPWRASGYAQALATSYDAVESVVGLDVELDATRRSLMNGSNVFIDCTNNPKSKEIVHQIAHDHNALFLSTGIAPGYGMYKPILPGHGLVEPALMRGFSELENETLASLDESDLRTGLVTKELVANFIAGMVVDDAVRYILFWNHPSLAGSDVRVTDRGNYDSEEELEFDRDTMITGHPLHFKFGYGAEMFHPLYEGEELRIVRASDIGNLSANLFGAGAIGANIGYWLARFGAKHIDYLDFDEVGITNVMRTLFYHDMVGQRKVDAATAKTMLISDRRSHSKGYFAKLDEHWQPERHYDIYVDGFDNFPSRYVASQTAIRDATPIVSASGRFNGFDAEVYIPDTTLCFDCNFDLARLAEEQAERERQSCGVEFTPQNTWMNMAVASASMSMMMSAVFPDIYGEPINGMVNYNPKMDRRLFVSSKQGECRHDSAGTGLIHHV